MGIPYRKNQVRNALQGSFHRIFSAFCLLFTQVLSAQQAVIQSNLPFDLLTIDQGLSQGFISCILQDRTGFMWFTTSDGLNKYDGYSFTVFHHDADDPTTLGSDYLSSITEDAAGRLWIGTRHNGVDVYDPRSDEFIHIRSRSSNGLISNDVLEVKADRSGHIWVRTDKGIDRISMAVQGPDPGQSGAAAFENSLRFNHIVADSLFDAVRFRYQPEKVFIDSRDRVFIMTNNKVWEVFNKGPEEQVHVTERYKFQVVDSFITASMLEDPGNHCLVLHTGKILQVPEYDFSAVRELYAARKMKIPGTIDERHQLWVPDSNRIIRIDLGTGAQDILQVTGARQIRTIAETTYWYADRNGAIWAGTSGFGLLKYNSQSERFHHRLPQFVAYQIAQARNGSLILNGILDFRIRGSQYTAKDFLVGKKARKMMLPWHIGFFTIDTAGAYWFGLTGSLVRYEPDGRVRSFPLPHTEKASLPTPVYADKHGGIWLGYNRYLFEFRVATGRFTRYDYPVQSNLYAYDFLQSIYDDGRYIWLGSTNGLFRLDRDSRQMTSYQYRPNDPSSLSNNSVLSLCNDPGRPGRFLWIGTRGGGLNRLDKQTGKMLRYSTKDGLPNNMVYCILPDDNGRVWLSTNKGISVLDPASNLFTNFDVSDGLQSNEFNRYAACKTREGLLVFGGMNGINYFDPAQISPLKAPRVILTNFRLFNKNVSFKDPGSPLPESITFCKQVTLQYEQNVFTLQFAAMDYRKAGSIRYRYKMEGFDKSWRYSATTREATYTNLNPGPYRFVVQASLSEGVWGGQEASVLITVVPPWWRTWWFYATILITTVSLLYALYRYRLTQLLKLERVRNRIARDLHDEVGSSISTIAIYSKVIQNQLKTTPLNTETLVIKIMQNAQEIMESMNDIIWDINTKNDAFELIISRMREHAYQLVEARGYTLHFHFDEALPRMKLHMEKRRDFYLIYKEALNNTVKYAQGKNVWIILKTDDAAIHLMIKDDGAGFEPGKINRGNGLANMRYRAAAIGGTIAIASAPGQGTTISLTFPI